MHKRVLVIAYDFPPHGAIGTMRTLRVVRRLVDTGWDVTVLTSDPRTFRAGTPVEETLVSQVPVGVRVVRAPVFRGFDTLKRAVKSGRRGAPVGPAKREQSSGNGPNSSRMSAARGLSSHVIDIVDAALAIPDHESGWLLPAVMQGLGMARRLGRPDVIYSSAPPWTGQLVARVLATALRCPWVADFRDPWSRAPWRGDRFRFARWAAARLERSVVRRADRVLFVARGNHDEFSAHYGPLRAQKFHVIPNGCDPTEFDALNAAAPGSEDPFVLLHAGSLYAGRSPGSLLKALATAIERRVIDATRFRLRFLGHLGLASIDLFRLCHELGLEDVVETVARVPRAKSLEAMRGASALLLLQPGHTVAVPAKLYEYLASGRPILAIAEEGETAEIVRRSGVGVFAAPDDDEGIVTALAALVRMSRNGIAAPPRELYDGWARAAETVRILDEVAGGTGRLLAGEPSVETAAQQVRPR